MVELLGKEGRFVISYWGDSYPTLPMLPRLCSC